MDKKLKIPMLISITSLILAILILFSIFPFGFLVNFFMKCEQNPALSAPCYIRYDINAILFLGIVSIGYFIIFIINYFKIIHQKGKNNNNDNIEKIKDKNK